MTDDPGAAAVLAEALVRALRRVPGLSQAADGVPIEAGDAHAVVEIGSGTAWGHKSGDGAELRFAVLIRSGGERPERARALSGAARAAVAGVGPVLSGWRLVSLAMLRARVTAAGRSAALPDWTGVVDYRARLLREQP